MEKPPLHHSESALSRECYLYQRQDLEGGAGDSVQRKGRIFRQKFFIFDLEFHFHICYTFPHIMFVQCFGLRGLVGHRCKYALK